MAECEHVTVQECFLCKHGYILYCEDNHVIQYSRAVPENISNIHISTQ